MKDRLACGCVWNRIREYGDVLVQCAAHAAGEEYVGSHMTNEEVERFVSLLKRTGFNVIKMRAKHEGQS